METPGQDKRESVEACLRNILKFPAFAASERMSAFLAYVVNETLEGRGDKLKGYTIGLSVFGFNDRFDPQTNSIVRVEATRLRKRLAEYYEGPGAADPIEIRINRGTYVPEFVERPQPAAPAPETVPPMPASELTGETRKARSASGFRLALLGLALAVAAGAAFLFLQFPSQDKPAQPAPRAASEPLPAAPALPPVVAIGRFENLPGSGFSDVDALALSRELVSALSRFDNLTVLDDANGQASAGHEYRLRGDISKSNERTRITIRLLSGTQNHVIWSRIFEGAQTEPGPARAAMVASISSTLARTAGVIFSDRYKKMAPMNDRTSGFECIVHGAKYFESPSEAAFQAARRCLERTLEANPKYAPAHSFLAMLTIDGYLRGFGEGDAHAQLARAAAASHEAISLSPQSAQAHLALFMARFYDKRFTDAFESAQRALSFNPYSIEIRARIGAAYISRADYDKGMALLRDVSKSVEHGPVWLEGFYFLSAYMAGDDATANRHAARTQSTRTPMGTVARIVMAHKRGDKAETAKWAGFLQEKFPRFARDIGAAFERMALADPIRAKLEADLSAAGVKVR